MHRWKILSPRCWNSLAPGTKSATAADADGTGGMAGRALVSRSRRRQRTFLGARAGHQAPYSAGIQRAPDDVASGSQQRAVQAERRAGWNADQVPSLRIWLGSGRSSQGRVRRLGTHQRRNPQARGRIALEITRTDDESNSSPRTQGGPYVDYTNSHWRFHCAGDARRIRNAGTRHAPVPRTAAGRQTHLEAAREIDDGGAIGISHCIYAGRRRPLCAKQSSTSSELCSFLQPASCKEILQAFDESVAVVREILPTIDDAEMAETWRLVAGEKEVLAQARGLFLRDVMFSHVYQHRGQFGVYLRLSESSGARQLGTERG